jgi:hypothetical protein
VSDFPFKIGPQGLQWIADRVRRDIKILGPRADEAVPCLSLALDTQTISKEGKLIARYMEPYFDIGFHSKETVRDGSFVQLDANGQSLVADGGPWGEWAVGTELILVTVDIGYPEASAQSMQVLKPFKNGAAVTRAMILSEHA